MRQAACAVSMFLPFLGRGAALSRGHRVRPARRPNEFLHIAQREVLHEEKC